MDALIYRIGVIATDIWKWSGWGWAYALAKRCEAYFGPQRGLLSRWYERRSVISFRLDKAALRHYRYKP
jgi:hypothetical protein